MEALFEDPEAVLNLDTFRTSGRRLRAGSDADVTDEPAVTAVIAVTAVTAVTLRVRHDSRQRHVRFFLGFPLK